MFSSVTVGVTLASPAVGLCCGTSSPSAKTSECSLAGDPAIIPKRNNKVSNGFDQCNVVGLQERIDFELQGNMDCEVAYHEDDGVPAN